MNDNPDIYLVSFGFTYCPDFCPNNLIKFSKIIKHDSAANKALQLSAPKAAAAQKTEPVKPTVSKTTSYEH